MVDEDIGVMYDQILLYLDEKINYFTDPATAGKEFNDFNAEFNLAEVIYIIQRQIKGRPTLGEAATIRAFRDIRATQAEYDIRLMTRADYFTDATAEEGNNKEKWTFNKKVGNLHMQGKDVGA